MSQCPAKLKRSELYVGNLIRRQVILEHFIDQLSLYLLAILIVSYMTDYKGLRLKHNYCLEINLTENLHIWFEEDCSW